MTILTTNTINAPSSKQKLWLAAIKPPMYSVAIIYVWVAAAVAWFETNHLNWTIFLTFVSASILILAWENLSNDVFDSETGIDKNKAHSIVNLTGNKSLIFWLGNLCLGLAILGMLLICWWQQDLTVMGLVLLCCSLGYMYQGPPFRLGYQGLGEILVFLSFGPLGMSAAYYSQTQSWSVTNLAASIIVGLGTMLILFCSHFHQVEDDIAAGKRSPIVRLGTKRGAKLLPWICGSLFAATGGFVIMGLFPISTLLSLVGLPFAIKLCRHVNAHHNQPHKVSNCKFIAVALHFWSGLWLGVGFLINLN